MRSCLAAILMATALLGGCGHSLDRATQTPLLLTDLDASDIATMAPDASFSPTDPLEGYNRSMYWFNAEFDRKIYIPVLRAYRYAVPLVLRQGIGNFFGNLGELRNGANGLLQARPEIASRALIRFAVNSTVGLLGTIDVASRLGVARHVEDFGQTLGYWGLPNGPFMVLPVFGPSSLRDTGGLIGDGVMGFTVPPLSTVNEVVFANPIAYAPLALSERDKISFRYFDSGSPFEYDIVRFLYLRKRELDVLQ